MRVGDYLARIQYIIFQYKGSLSRSVETLRSLVLTHKLAVPYTNVELVNDEKPRLDVDEMCEKIVKNNGGGVCRELNGLYGRLFEQLEFDVTKYNAKFFVELKKSVFILRKQLFAVTKHIIVHTTAKES